MLQKLYEEVLKVGFQACRPDKAIAEMGLTKGAYYHYFESKQDMGYALLDEVVRPLYLSYWQPLVKGHTPVVAQLIQHLEARALQGPDRVKNPLSFVIQEMAGLEPGFHQRLQSLMTDLMTLLEAALEQDQAKQFIRPELDTKQSARFILAALEGISALERLDLDTEEAALHALIHYLKSLTNHKP
ncbi:MAG: TetR/AcrR family transcriptional regulator [Cytophagales bacterium]|nr:TetR/AcrR family transcriptional regulator [Cytophagales bacterium]